MRFIGQLWITIINMDTVKILNCDIDNLRCDELLAKLSKGVLFTPNVDHLVKLQVDSEFYSSYKCADWRICDSKVLQLAAKFINIDIKEVIPGSSFFSRFYTYHRDNLDITIFLLGAKQGVAEMASNRINNIVGRNIVVGSYSPSFGFETDEMENEEIVKLINKSKASVVVVGLGAPKQENWIIRNRNNLPNVNIFMALGATIDFEAGVLKRAPLIWQKLYLEWLYRLILEPKRLWKRYLVEDIRFFNLVWLQKINRYKDPFK